MNTDSGTELAKPAEEGKDADKPKGQGSRQVDRLGTDKIGSLIARFAIPAIFGMVANGAYNIIDGIFMGWGIGDIGLATAMVSMPIMTFSMAVSMLIGAGGNALVALRLGEGRHDQAERILGICFTMFVIAGLVCTTVIQLFLKQLIALTGAPPEVAASSAIYLRVISSGVTLQFFGMGFNNFIRTAGDPNRALYTMISGVVVSTFFNWLFVLQLHWGVAGSATATICGQATNFCMVMFYFCLSKKAPFKLHLKNLAIDPKIALKVMSLGSANFCMQIAGSFISMFSLSLITRYGALSPIGAGSALAGLGVVGRIVNITFFPIMGCAVAAQPLFGFNYGAKNYQRVKRTFWVAYRWMLCFGLVLWAVVQLFAVQIAFAFAVQDELLEFTAHAMRIQLFMIPVMGLQMLSANFFQSTGQPVKSLILSMTRQLIYLLPMIYFLPILLPMLSSNFIGLDGIYFSYPVADTLSVVTAALMIRREFKKIDRMIAEQQSEQAALTAQPA